MLAPITSIAQAETDRILVRGRDLCGELLGTTGFTAYFLFLVTGERPTPLLVKVVDATLVAIAEHGLVPSVVAARMTYAAAPDAMQGAVAAGLLGCGSVILGASETAGRLLVQILGEAEEAGEAGQGGIDGSARRLMQDLRDQRRSLPGFGHPIHRNGDPRAARLLALARDWGVAGRHVEALMAVQRAVEPIWGRPLVLNVSGAIPAVLLDAGYPVGALRGIPLLARTASLVAHLLEESARPSGFVIADAAAAAVTYDGGAP